MDRRVQVFRFFIMSRNNIPAFTLALLLAATPALADVATLNAPPSGGALSPDGAVQFTLSPDIPQDRLNRLFVEFDGYDVTNMVAMNGLVVTFQPAQRLSPGDYRLRVLEKNGAGKFSEMENWTVRVAGAGAGDSTVDGNLDAQYSALVANNLRGAQREDPHQLQASLNTVAKTGGPGWDASLQLNGGFDSEARRNPDGNRALLGEYLATARSFSPGLNTALRLGNHDTGVSNLLMDQFYRRGVSGVADIMDRFTLTGFSQDPARAVGTPNPEGFGDPGQRASGVFGRVYPLPSGDKRVFVETGYYTAEGTIRGNGTTVADNTANAGHGWVAAAEGQTPDDRMNLRGDFARSAFDDDGSGALVTEKYDDAERLRFTFAPRGSLKAADANEAQWTLTLLAQRVGTYFRSIVNATLPQDESRLGLSSNYQHGTVSLTGETYVSQNNVDDESALPRDRTCGALGQLSFTPFDLNDKLSPDGWFTYSTFSAGASWTGQKRDRTPAAFAGPGLDQTTWTANGGWTAAFTSATLSLNNVYSNFRDDVTGLNSYDDDMTTLSLSYTPVDRLTLTPAVQYERLDRRNGGVSSKSFLSLDTSATLIPDKLTHSFHYGALLDSSAAGEQQRNASTTLTWQLKPAAKNDPGIALALSGYYQDLKTSAAAPLPASPQSVPGEDFKVYLQLKISTPFGF